MILPSRTVDLDLELYPLAALDRALEAYEEHCHIDIANGAGRRAVTIQPRAGAPAATADEFLSYLLGAALDIHLQRLAER